MAARREVLQKRDRLRKEMLLACREGRWKVGEMVPSQGELARQYGLSAAVVHEELRKLVEEGVLYAVPRVGTFVGPPRHRSAQVFLLILPFKFKADEFGGQIHIGFEERIAQLGGVSLMLSAPEAREHLEEGDLPPLQGVFEVNASPLIEHYASQGVPCVSFGADCSNPGVSTIHFDDVDGGEQATRHLLAMGHQRIAFLGLHPSQNPAPQWEWSVERELGWRRAMSAAGGRTDLAFLTRANLPIAGESLQMEAARQASQELVRRRDVEAVVAANAYAVRGLFAALQDARVPLERWPAVVGFDEDPMISGAVVSTMRLSWDAIGRGAAQMLFDRASGQAPTDEQQHLVPMRLIPRLSCREQWTSTSRLTKRQTATAAREVVPLLPI